MKWLKRILIALAVIFVIIQFIRPERTNPPVDETKTIQANTQMPPEVATILERSCNDCHSSYTTWPWYSNVAPASWFLADHVNEARGKLSLSNWASYDTKRRAKKLEEICEEVKEGEMPLSSYLFLHPDAALSEADKATLCAWVKQERGRVTAGQEGEGEGE